MELITRLVFKFLILHVALYDNYCFRYICIKHEIYHTFVKLILVKLLVQIKTLLNSISSIRAIFLT